MPSINDLPQTCTADEAVDWIAAVAPSLDISADTPDVRTLRLWRTKQQLTIEGRRFTRRNLLEVLSIVKLRQDGLTQQNAVKRTLAGDEDRLRSLLVGTASTPFPHADVEPLITLQLLAKGILEQYRLVSKGAVVGHTSPRETGSDKNMPLSLQQAMARLGRHYFAEDQEDHAASVHQLLQLCMDPLGTWAPRALGELEKYQNAVLIDPVYRVPNEDCEIIAEEADGTHLSDLVERHLHEGLRSTLKQLGEDADVAYTTIRGFVGRHPLATAGELQQLYLNPELNDEAIAFVRNLYVPVHASDARDGHVRRCAHCNALISANVCSLAGCHHDYPTKDALSVPLNVAYIARPEVLKYWADPAREELRLYDELMKNRVLRERVLLYPHSDWCDVAIGEDVGVDVKDYHDPVRLAQRINRSLGNLGHYPERILAIAKRRWSNIYRDRLIEQLNPDKRTALQVMSVDEAIAHIRKNYGGSRARKA